MIVGIDGQTWLGTSPICHECTNVPTVAKDKQSIWNFIQICDIENDRNLNTIFGIQSLG